MAIRSYGFSVTTRVAAATPRIAWARLEGELAPALIAAGVEDLWLPRLAQLRPDAEPGWYTGAVAVLVRARSGLEASGFVRADALAVLAGLPGLEAAVAPDRRHGRRRTVPGRGARAHGVGAVA